MVSLKRWFSRFERPQPVVSRMRVRRQPEKRWRYLEMLEERQMMAGAPTQLLFTVQPSQVAAGSAMFPTIQVTVADFTGQAVTTDTSTIRLFITTSPQNGTFSTGSTITVVASGGVANFTNVSFTTVGSYNITAGTVGSPNLTSLPSNLFTVTPAATHLAFIQPPADVGAGSLFGNSLTVAVEDANGNLVSTDRSNITLSIATGPTNGNLTGTTTVQAVNGIATFNGVTLPKIGSYRLQVRDSAPGIVGATSNSFTVTPGAAASLSFGQQPTNTPASGVVNPNPTVFVLDSLGNIVTNDTSTITLSVASGPFGGSIAGTFAVPVVNGIATFSNISFPTIGVYSLQATDGALNAVASNTFAVTGPPAKVVFFTQPTQTTLNHTMSSFTLLVEDAAGNLVANDTSSVTIAIATGPGSGTISGTTTVNAVNGVATFTGLSFSASGTYTLVASDSALTNATSNPFLINGPASKVVFVQQPIDSAAGAPLTNPVIVQVQDSSGNVVIDDSSAVSITLNSTTGGAVSGSTVVNASNGIATFTNLIPTAPGTFTLTAADGALTGATSTSFAVAPSASKLIITQQPVAVAATSTMPPIIVHVENSNNTTVATNTSQVHLAIVSGPSNGSINGITAVNAVAGIATFSNLKFTVPGTYQLVAFDGSLATDTSVTFTVSGPPTKLVIIEQPLSSVTAGNTASGFTIQVAVRDASGNTVTTDTSTVRLAISTGPAGATIIGYATATAVNGIATFTGLAFNTAGTSYKLTASDATLTSATTSSFKVVPDIASAHLAFVSGTSSALVGVKAPTAIVLDVVDKFNNVITTDSSSVTLAVITGPGSGVLSGTKTVKASKGVVTFKNLIFSEAGTYTIKATDAKFSSPSTVTNSTISFAQVITPAITTIGAPSVAKSYLFGGTITLSDTIKSLVTTPVHFTTGDTASLVDASDSSIIFATGTVTATGAVKFNQNNSTSGFDVGAHAVRIIFGGDNNHTGGQSPAFTLNVVAANVSTIALALNPPLGGTASSFAAVATISTKIGTVPTGLIEIEDVTDALNPVIVGTITLAGPTPGTFTLTGLSAGTHKYRADYLGDNIFKPSFSSIKPLAVT